MSALLAFGISALTATAYASPPNYGGEGHGPGHGYGPPGWQPSPPGSNSWDLKKFTSLVAFGDSYTDDGRFGYFVAHGGSAPPVGYPNPADAPSAGGGRTWAQYVKQYTGVNLYNYAVSGATCSNRITPRYLPLIHGYFPTVEEYEVPAYIADSKYVLPDGEEFVHAPQDETVYSIWIGTNDLGVYALLTDSQVKGTNVASYENCVYEQLKRLYQRGGRYFVIQNVAPLDLAPLYGLPGKGGVVSDPLYWPDKPKNLTEISGRMGEMVVGVNEVYKWRTPAVARLGNDFPEARFAAMDMHSLITDIYNNPTQYLNGTAPANVTGTAKGCNLEGLDCQASTSPDSFLWYDSLHPSEQTGRVIAKNFVDVVRGRSKYATYW